MTDWDSVESESDIVGTWTRPQRDDDPYPDELTFESSGLYSGRKAPGSSQASKLDLGVFERIDENAIRLTTATDRDETFAVETSSSVLKLVDEEGIELLYARQTDQPADTGTGAEAVETDAGSDEY